MTASTPRPTVATPTQRLARQARARHDRLGPKLDCDGFEPAVSADGDSVFCRGCGLVLVRGVGSGKEDNDER